ncbi:thioesterase II family protein [Peterkaempfera bronchialis]|uniref:Alpha/beta fold hydrolase n=1 Tax=Peterkaempfera bronchialis TaxID=2126346 RepID=A0A345SST4_9ACTN|nr:alpha/beta fold hydrolase [Peterkaempfera bronchialis]AXI76789.1 alpha/beta fold hydrolase [Peterkaempfera bronchialis]
MSPDSPSIVVFPGAGSFGTELRGLLAELGPSAWLARYPGRFGRDFGQGAGTFQEVVRSCVAQVERRRPSRAVLVGHSFGAYAAHATARELEELGTVVSALVVVGATAPALLTVPEPPTLRRSDTVAYLEGIDPDLLPDEADEWREIVIDTTMQDLRLLREFTTSQVREVRCPILAVRGAADPLASTSGIGAWADATSGGCTREEFPGGHSDLLRTPEFASWLREACLHSYA